MNRSNAPQGATVGGRQSDEPAAMSLRERSCQSRERPRKWTGSDAGRLYVEQVTTGVVTAQGLGSHSFRGLLASNCFSN